MTRAELFENIQRKQSFLCVGLDTDVTKIPEHLFDESDDSIFAFNKAIIDATADLCVAYKPNLAFYESIGLEGWEILERTVEYIRSNYPDQFIIADAKRGDIGNTSAMYARAFFGNMDFDSVTVAPYMGEDSVKPFLTYENKWVTLLALTSNKGAFDFQLMRDAESGERLFEKVPYLTDLGQCRQYDVCSGCHQSFHVERCPYHCARPFPIGTRHWCTRRQPAGSV